MRRKELVIGQAMTGGLVYILTSFLLVLYSLDRFNQHSTYSLLSLFTALSDPIKS